MPESIYSCNYTNIFHLVMLRRCTRAGCSSITFRHCCRWLVSSCSCK